jgi:hypothetical protein
VYGFVPSEVEDCYARDAKMSIVPSLPPRSTLSPSEKIAQGNAALERAKTELGIEHYFEAAHFDYSGLGGPEKLLGVKAAKDMRGNGDIIVKVPYTSLWTWTAVEDDPVLKVAIGSESKTFKTATEWLEGEMESFDPWMLPLLLLYHLGLGEKSKFHNYIEYIFDTDLESFPIFMSNDKMDEWYPPTEFPKLKDETMEDRKWAWEFYDKILEPLSEEHPEIFGKEVTHKGKPIASFDSYAWASNMVASRYWGANFGDYPSGQLVPKRENDSVSHLAPVAELMNFGKGGGCIKCTGEYASSWVSGFGSEGSMTYDQMSFVCRAYCPIKKGEEV